LCSNIINDFTIEHANTVNSIGLTCSLENTVCDEDIRSDNIELYINDEVITEHMSMEFFKDEKLLHRDENGKVCKVGFISLMREHKRHQITKKLHEKHLQILSDNNFKQMQLTAILDGLAVWPLLLFKFETQEFKEMWVNEVFTYMIEILGYNSKKAKRLSNADMHDIAPLLRPQNKEWFSNWVKNSMALRMYKDIR